VEEGNRKTGSIKNRYTVIKGLAVFPSQAGMSLAKLFLARNNLPSPSLRKV